MRDKKKWIVVVIMAMALTLCACNSEDDRSSDEVEETQLDADAMI